MITINSPKNLKETAFISGKNSDITIKFITQLSSPYDSSSYKGTMPTSNIKAIELNYGFLKQKEL